MLNDVRGFIALALNISTGFGFDFLFTLTEVASEESAWMLLGIMLRQKRTPSPIFMSVRRNKTIRSRISLIDHTPQGGE